MWMLPRRRNVHTADDVAAAFERCFHVVRHAAYVRRVEAIAAGENIETIERDGLSEQRQRLRGDVRVDAVLHARLRLPRVVHAAGDAQLTLATLRQQNGDAIA